MKIPDHIKRMVRERGKLMAAMGDQEKAKRTKPRKSTWSFRSIANLVKKANAFMGKGDLERSQQSRSEAEDLALENLRQRTILHHLEDPKPGTLKKELRNLIDHCENLIEAIEGETKKAKQDSLSRFLDAVNDHWNEHGEAPTHKDLVNRGLRKELITDQSTYLKRITGKSHLRKLKPGRKDS